MLEDTLSPAAVQRAGSKIEAIGAPNDMLDRQVEALGLFLGSSNHRGPAVHSDPAAYAADPLRESPDIILGPTPAEHPAATVVCSEHVASPPAVNALCSLRCLRRKLYSRRPRGFEDRVEARVGTRGKRFI